MDQAEDSMRTSMAGKDGPSHGLALLNLMNLEVNGQLHSHIFCLMNGAEED